MEFQLKSKYWELINVFLQFFWCQFLYLFPICNLREVYIVTLYDINFIVSVLWFVIISFPFNTGRHSTKERRIRIFITVSFSAILISNKNYFDCLR